MKRISAIIFVFFLAMQVFCQGVFFHSAEIEAGVKKHIGLVEGEAVTVEQLDTITTLNLSGLGITDIQDVKMIPNIQRINLSYNEIDDVTPLAKLDYLMEVDLSHNMLNSINMLAFSPSESMTVNVAFNYISDFSCFNTLTSCIFIIAGAGLQKTHNDDLFNINYLYCNSTTEKAEVTCRVEANDGEHVWLNWQGTDVIVPVDNSIFTYEIGNAINSTYPIYVTNGTQKDSTFYVPLAIKEVKPLESVRVETGLPSNFSIHVLPPIQQGSINIDGTSIEYVASKEFKNEEIFYVYNNGSIIKGISKILLSSDITGIEKKTVDDVELKVSSLGHRRLLVSCNSSSLPDFSELRVYDSLGKIYISENINTKNGLNKEIILHNFSGRVVILQLISNGHSYVKQVFLY